MGPVYLTLFLLALSAEGILGQSLCTKTFNGSESGTVFSKDVGNATNCTFTFLIKTAEDTIMLFFSSLMLENGGAYIVIAAEKIVIANISSGRDPMTVVSTKNQTTVTVINPSAAILTGIFELNYNTKECKQSVNPLSGILSSPKYTPGTSKPIKCTYIVTSPVSQSTLLGFASFTLNTGNLTVDGKKVTVGTNNTLPDDQLLLSSANSTIVLTIPNTENKTEGFSSTLSLVNSDCSSQTFKITEPFSYISSSGAVCHLTIDGSIGTLVTTVQSWVTDSSDQLLLRDGASQGNKLISGSPVQANMKFVTSGSKMSVHLVFVPTFIQRQVQISFTSQASVGLVPDGGTISYDSAKSGGQDGVFQCTLDAGKKVSLTDFINITGDNKVEVYDGNVVTGTPVFTIMKTTLPIPIFMKSNQMTVVTKSGSSNYTFTAKTGEARENDQFSSSGLGSYAVNAAGPNDNYTYNLVILPSTTAGAGYRGTLQLTSLSLCAGDVVTIYEGSTTISDNKMLVKLTENIPFIPQIVFDAGKGARIVTALSSCMRRKVGEVVLTASYDIKTLISLCGKQPSSTSGTVLSPYYPLRYPLNLNCSWTFPNKTNSSLYISVVKLDVKVGNSLMLTGDKTPFNFTAETLKRDLIFNKSKDLILSFTYESQDGSLVIPGDGFNISYQYLDCGGNITTNFSELLGGNKIDCRWIINLRQTPTDSTLSHRTVYNIIAMLSVTENYKAGSLIVYDGTSMKDEHRLNLINLDVRNILIILSRADSFIIQYINNDMTAKEFKLTVNISSRLCIQFCQNGVCLHEDWICNGINDCGDNTDELNCTGPGPLPPLSCPTPQPETEKEKVCIKFCQNGICLHEDWICNGINDCGDNTDEVQCIGTTPIPTTPSPHAMVQPESDKGKVPGFWIAVALFLGLIVGVILPFLIPATVRRVRKRNYNHSLQIHLPDSQDKPNVDSDKLSF